MSWLLSDSVEQASHLSAVMESRAAAADKKMYSSEKTKDKNLPLKTIFHSAFLSDRITIMYFLRRPLIYESFVMSVKVPHECKKPVRDGPSLLYEKGPICQKRSPYI